MSPDPLSVHGRTRVNHPRSGSVESAWMMIVRIMRLSRSAEAARPGECTSAQAWPPSGAAPRVASPYQGRQMAACLMSGLPANPPLAMAYAIKTELKLLATPVLQKTGARAVAPPIRKTSAPSRRRGEEADPPAARIALSPEARRQKM